MVLVDKNTKSLVQGITGREGRFHTEQMLKYGTKIVAGVTPGKGGSEISNIPVFDKINEALEIFPEINSTILFVPAKFCKNAVVEAIEAGISLIVIITEGIPLLDEIYFIQKAKIQNQIIIGPNTPGIISPKVKCKMGIMPAKFFREGNIGVCSRSGTLMYELVLNLNKFGISTSIGIGGDPVIGIDFVEILRMFENDLETKAIVLIGEIGGNLEENAAEFIKKEMNKPVIGYIAGRTIKIRGKKFGHAGALISTYGLGTAKSKIRKLESAGVKIAKVPSEISENLEELL